MPNHIQKLILAVIIIVGLLLFLVQSVYCQVNTFWYNLFGNVANALLITGTLTLLYEIFMRKQRDEELSKLFNITLSIKRSGLQNIYTDSSVYDYGDIIENATTFSAIMNDGLRWVQNNSIKLQRRFSRAHTVTEFFIVDPDGAFFQALAIKTDKQENELRQKIENSVNLLKDTFNKSEGKGTLKIYYLKNYPTQSIFYSDKRIIVTSYQTSGGRSIIPLFEYEYTDKNESIGLHLQKDLAKVRDESKIIWDSTHN